MFYFAWKLLFGDRLVCLFFILVYVGYTDLRNHIQTKLCNKTLEYHTVVDSLIGMDNNIFLCLSVLIVEMDWSLSIEDRFVFIDLLS